MEGVYAFDVFLVECWLGLDLLCSGRSIFYWERVIVEYLDSILAGRVVES